MKLYCENFRLRIIVILSKTKSILKTYHYRLVACLATREAEP